MSFSGGPPAEDPQRGPRLLRSALVEVAWIMLRRNLWARAQYERLCGGQKTRKKKAIVAVARKLLVRCWVMLLRKEPWHPETMVKQPAGIAVAM
jgi:transposase